MTKRKQSVAPSYALGSGRWQVYPSDPGNPGAGLWSTENILPVVAFLVMVAYMPVAGNAVALRWGVLWLILPTLLIVSGGNDSPWMKLLGLISFAVLSIAAMLRSPLLLDGISEIISFMALAMAFFIGLECKSLHQVFRFAAYGIGLSSFIAVLQWLGYDPIINLARSPSGLFLNGNYMAEASCLVLVGLLASGSMTRPAKAVWLSILTVPAIILPSQQPKDRESPSNSKNWLLIFITLPALLLPLHRGSMIALGIAGMTWLLSILSNNWRWKAGIGALLTIAIAVLWLNLNGFWIALPPSIAERLQIYHGAWNGLTWFGHGAGTFHGMFPLFAPPDMDTVAARPWNAHNDILELAFEYGVFAIIPVIFFGMCLPFASRSPLSYVLLVFVVEGFSDFPLFMPATGFLAALCAGHVCRDWDRNRVVEWLRRMVFRAGHPARRSAQA